LQFYFHAPKSLCREYSQRLLKSAEAADGDYDTNPMSFQLGQRIGGYEFVDVLESTRNSIVYRVRNVAQRRFESLRVLAAAVQEDPVRVERFLREGKILSRISHPNILTFYSAESLDGQLILTTELLEGSTLAQRVELGPIPWAETCDYFFQTLSALGYAHARGVVHREITPASILVTPDGVVKLINFGLAKGAADPQLTVAGAVLGSLYYMSPEQVKGASVLDARSDIYSAGVTLYKILTGRVPFDCESQFDVMLAHVQAQPVLPSAMHSGVPPLFDTVVLQAMAKDPAQRFGTAEEFRDALEAVKLALEGATDAAPANLAQLSAEIPASGSRMPSVELQPAPVLTPMAAEPPAASAPPIGAVPTRAGAGPAPWKSPQWMLAGVVVFLVTVLTLLILFRPGRS